MRDGRASVLRLFVLDHYRAQVDDRNWLNVY
jgi:hypothetical protein